MSTQWKCIIPILLIGHTCTIKGQVVGRYSYPSAWLNQLVTPASVRSDTGIVAWGRPQVASLFNLRQLQVDDSGRVVVAHTYELEGNEHPLAAATSADGYALLFQRYGPNEGIELLRTDATGVPTSLHRILSEVPGHQWGRMVLVNGRYQILPGIAADTLVRSWLITVSEDMSDARGVLWEGPYYDQFRATDVHERDSVLYIAGVLPPGVAGQEGRPCIIRMSANDTLAYAIDVVGHWTSVSWVRGTDDLMFVATRNGASDFVARCDPQMTWGMGRMVDGTLKPGQGMSDGRWFATRTASGGNSTIIGFVDLDPIWARPASGGWQGTTVSMTDGTFAYITSKAMPGSFNVTRFHPDGVICHSAPVALPFTEPVTLGITLVDVLHVPYQPLLVELPPPNHEPQSITVSEECSVVLRVPISEATGIMRCSTAVDGTSVKVEVPDPHVSRIEVFDSLGRALWSERIASSAGSSWIHIPLVGLEGMVILRASTQGQTVGYCRLLLAQ
jgi:hypothetical protein